MNTTEQRLDRVEQMMETLLEKLTQLVTVPITSSAPTTTPDLIKADEAAEILGFPRTTSRTYTRRLKWYRENGHLVKFWGTNKIYYSRKEITALAERIRKQEVIIPPVV